MLAVLCYFVKLFICFALQTERTYFQVYLPKESQVPSLPMFFCSKWSVGKVVDYAASLASLKNSNNVLTAKVMFAYDALFFKHLRLNWKCVIV